MTHLSMGLLAPLFILVLCAAVTDARSRRIPNWLTGCGILLGFGLHAALEGWSGVRFAAAGMGTGFALYLALYAVRALGAGDVKLMAAVGAFAGAANWLQIFMATAIAGGVAALILALAKGRLRTTVWNASFIASELLHFRAPYAANHSLDVRSPASLSLPHGIAIALGVTFTCFY